MLKVATKWVAIGILFDIPYERLQIYEAEEDLEKRVSRLVEAWIDNELGSKPTWKRLVEVIASKAGGDHQALAKKLASDHQPSEAEEQGTYCISSIKCRGIYLLALLVDLASIRVSHLSRVGVYKR